MMLKDFIVSEDASLKEAMNQINRNAVGVLFVCRADVLIAAISDGDIRRAIISGADLQAKISKYANYNPVKLGINEKRMAERVMREKQITAVPIVRDNGTIADIRFLLKDTINKSGVVDIPVAIMAGGKGTRLKPYTDVLPKPLIPIGDKTITEHIIDKFADLGCKEFYMVVNYKKEFIKAYFTDSSEREPERIPRFVEEQDFYGTGGGILLLKDQVKSTFFLTNCDILVDMDYSDALKKHKEMGNLVTMVCANKKVTIPYGTVETDSNGYIKGLKEKPTFSLQTNTGFYIIEPGFFDYIPASTHIDITDIIDKCLKNNEKIGVYTIEDSDWMDMGQLDELERMKEKLGL